MNKVIKFNNEARLLIQEGVNEVADAIKVTLGPRGKNVIIRGSNGKSIITKDGITVAKSIDFDDEYKSIGVELIRDISESANDISGDGSSTSAIIGSEMINAGIKRATSGQNPMAIKEGIDIAVKEVIKELKKHSVKADAKKIKQVAIISTNGDKEIGDLVSDVQLKIGNNGIAHIEKAFGFQTTSKIEEGYSYDQGYLSNDFITDQGSMSIEMINPFIYISSELIKDIDEIIPVLEYSKSKSIPLLIIAEDIHENVIEILAMNKLNGLNVAAIKTPGYEKDSTPMAEDLCVFTNTTLANKNEDKENYALGTAKKVVITRDSTTIIEGSGDKEVLNQLVKDLTKRTTLDTVSDFDKDTIKERIARLTGSVAVINVGAQTEIERKERRDRIHDALGATKSAMEEGIIPGGGIALLKASKVLDTLKGKNSDETSGIEIVKEAIKAPIKQILLNAEQEVPVVINKILNNKSNDYGFNAKTNKYEHFIKEGIIDPFKVTRVALEKSASIAGLFLMTDCVITNKNN